MMKKILMLLVGTVFFASVAMAESLQATVENSQIPLGETIELKIAYDGDNGNTLQPDLSVLQKDFTIYGTSTSVQSSFINGQSHQKREWNVSLLPSGEGKYVIPAIIVGKFKTTPIEVEILPAGTPVVQSGKNHLQNTPQEPSFSADMTVDNENPYVQQQINAVVTLYDNRGITLQQEPMFADSKDWIVKSLGNPEVENKNGMREIKFFYALFPQKSGHITLPTAQINGFYVSYEETQPSHQSLGGFFKFFDMNIDSMFGVQKPVVLKTKPKAIEVQPVSAANGNNWWLPADAVSLLSKWEDSRPEFKVGEIVAREFTLTASGVAETQLPDIVFPESRNIKQYPENPQVSSVQHGDKIISQATVRVVYIPQEGGEQILPEITVPWFDVNKQTMAYATVPTTKIFVKGQAATTSAQRRENADTKKENVSKSLSEGSQTKTQNEVNYWRLGIIILFAFLAGLFLSYVLLRRKTDDVKELSRAHLTDKIAEDLETRDYRTLRDDLLQWGGKIFSHHNINNLYDLADCIGDEKFKEQMEKLNAALYAGETILLDKEFILHEINQKYKKSKQKQTEKPLPDLYK